MKGKRKTFEKESEKESDGEQPSDENGVASISNSDNGSDDSASENKNTKSRNKKKRSSRSRGKQEDQLDETPENEDQEKPAGSENGQKSSKRRKKDEKKPAAASEENEEDEYEVNFLLTLLLAYPIFIQNFSFVLYLHTPENALRAKHRVCPLPVKLKFLSDMTKDAVKLNWIHLFELSKSKCISVHFSQIRVFSCCKSFGVTNFCAPSKTFSLLHSRYCCKLKRLQFVTYAKLVLRKSYNFAGNELSFPENGRGWAPTPFSCQSRQL